MQRPSAFKRDIPVMESGRVVRVVDGDTYDVLAAGVVRRVRLLGVDAPEHDQPFGQQVTDSVAGVLWARPPHCQPQPCPARVQ